MMLGAISQQSLIINSEVSIYHGTGTLKSISGQCGAGACSGLFDAVSCGEGTNVLKYYKSILTGLKWH